MHINVFCEASFGLRGRKLVNCFDVTLRYETEQPSSLGCNYEVHNKDNVYRPKCI